MRIALFHNLPSGGGKRVAFEFVKRLIDTHEIDLYIYDQKAEDFLDLRPLVANTILVNGGDVFIAPMFGRLLSIIKARNASKKAARLINDGNYDIALVMQCSITNSPFILRYLNIPCLYFCHEPFAKIMEPHYRSRVKDNFFNCLKKLVLKWLISIDRKNATSATKLCTSSLYSIENIYRNYGVYPSLNYLGVDTEIFYCRDIDREKIILCVGSLNAAKAQDFVIKSIGTMKEKPKIKFIYNFAYGDTEYKDQLVQLAKQLGVSVTFECLVSDGELVAAYNTSILTVFPSMLEPLGLVPLESMACGTPVIGIAEAGIRETVINNQTGILTERDPYEFGRAISRMLNEKETWQGMSMFGQKWVRENWTWRQAVQNLEKNIKKII